MIGVDYNRGIMQALFVIRFVKAHYVFVMIIGNIVSVNIDTAAKYGMRIGIAGRANLITAVFKFVRNLSGVNRIEQNGQRPVHRILNADRHVETAGNKSMLLILGRPLYMKANPEYNLRCRDITFRRRRKVRFRLLPERADALMPKCPLEYR